MNSQTHVRFEPSVAIRAPVRPISRDRGVSDGQTSKHEDLRLVLLLVAYIG